MLPHILKLAVRRHDVNSVNSCCLHSSHAEPYMQHTSCLRTSPTFCHTCYLSFAITECFVCQDESSSIAFNILADAPLHSISFQASTIYQNRTASTHTDRTSSSTRTPQNRPPHVILPHLAHTRAPIARIMVARPPDIWSEFPSSKQFVAYLRRIHIFIRHHHSSINTNMLTLASFLDYQRNQTIRTLHARSISQQHTLIAIGVPLRSIFKPVRTPASRI